MEKFGLATDILNQTANRITGPINCAPVVEPLYLQLLERLTP
jgi:hypothetical protein